jgi:SAM-dependent methyltransferase
MQSTNHQSAQTSVLKQLSTFMGSQICDLACGTGEVTSIISKFLDASFTLVDFSDAMILNAKQKLSHLPQTEFHQVDIHNVSCLGKQFDTFICSFGFYWLDDPKMVLDQIRSCSLNAHLILIEEHFFDSNDHLPAFRSNEPGLNELAALETYLGIQSLIDMCVCSGYTLRFQTRHPIDRRHELVGLVFRIEGN